MQYLSVDPVSGIILQINHRSLASKALLKEKIEEMLLALENEIQYF